MARLLQTTVLLVFALGSLYLAPSSAQPSPTSECRAVLIPEGLSTTLDGTTAPGILCPGQRLKIEAAERETEIEAAGVKVEEEDEDFDLRAPRAIPPDTGSAQVVDTETLEQLGYKVSRKEETVTIETPTTRYEKKEEETEVKGDGFKYSSEESEEETEGPGFSSEEESSEETYKTRG